MEYLSTARTCGQEGPQPMRRREEGRRRRVRADWWRRGGGGVAAGAWAEVWGGFAPPLVPPNIHEERVLLLNGSLSSGRHLCFAFFSKWISPSPLLATSHACLLPVSSNSQSSRRYSPAKRSPSPSPFPSPRLLQGFDVSDSVTVTSTCHVIAHCVARVRVYKPVNNFHSHLFRLLCIAVLYEVFILYAKSFLSVMETWVRL